MSSTNHAGDTNGPPLSTNRQPAWDPNALLNPRSANQTPTQPQPPTSSFTPRMEHTLPHSSPVEFIFPGATPSATTGRGTFPHLPHRPSQDQNAPVRPASVGNFVERMNKVQDRSDVPQPKRRKTENEDDVVSITAGAFHRGGIAALSQYVKDKRDEGKAGLGATRVETVDLTGNDEEVIDLDKTKEQEKDEEVCYGMIEGASINCHKVPAPKPGMMSIGGSDYWPQVKVVLRRKLDETTSKIHVYDHTREVFGLVDAKTSNGLSPILDSSLHIRTDCRIPSRRRQPDEQLGKPTSRQYKLELMVYGPRKYARQIGKHLASRMLSLVSPPRVDAGVKVFNPHSKEARGPPNSRYSQAGSEGYSYPPPPPVARTAEEVRSEIMGVFDSLTKSEDLPELEPSPLVLTELLKHQKQALYFMVHREEGKSPLPEAASSVNSTWQIKKGRNGEKLYYNVITSQAQRDPPPASRGGILADMMGLGKTLSVLSLITKTLEDASDWSSLPPVQPQHPEKNQTPHSKQFNMPKAQGLALTPLRHNGKATLLICPLSTITNWEEQIKQHIRLRSLSYHIYHGPGRIKDVDQLSQFDLVITTYGSVSSELNARHRNKKGPFPLEEIGWFRIVLDEAHMIREQSTLQFKAVCRLQASRRWAVTGTPVQNRLDDLAALLAFLRLKPFDDKGKFLQYIVAPFKNADPEIVPKLRVLVDTITLRRLKDKINLPMKTERIVRLQFSPEEQRIYDLFAKNAQDRVRVLTGQSQDKILGGKTYIHILQSILRLRLLCAHGKELLNDDDLQHIQGMTADSPIDLDSDDEAEKPALQEGTAYQLFDLMKETNNDNCVKCSRKLGANDAADIESERQEDILGYMTPCFHVYCAQCVNYFRDDRRGITHNSNSYGNCPVCDTRVKFSCVELRHTRADVEHEDTSQPNGTSNSSAKKVVTDDRNYGGPHTKTRALIEDLLVSEAETAGCTDGPPYKSVVFSGWTSHLDLIQVALDNVGINYTRLDGKMSRVARTAAMETFRTDTKVHVILVSIMAGGLGLNLTAANNVYVMEPQYNPAAEAQAIDRVHRLGQTREVRTTRYIMSDSFEEKMLELQDKKKKLASLSMDGRDKDKVMDRTEAARQRLMDLRSLFK